MPRDLDHILYETETFLERQLGSRALRQASKRRVQRGIREVGRRIRRAAILFLALVGLMIVASVAGASIGFFTWLVALPTILLACLVSLLFPAGRRTARSHGDPATAPLDRLASETEDWLIDRCRGLPPPALPAVEAIIDRLREMQHVAPPPEGTPLEGEARRLLGQHLPRLVESYLALPAPAKGPGSDNDVRLEQSLDLVADELTRLCVESGQCRSDGFEVQSRFIESRYRGTYLGKGRP